MEYTLEATAGAVFEYRLDPGDGIVFVPHAGLEAGLGANTSGHYLQGSVSAGMRIEADGGAMLNLQARASLGAGGVRSIAGTATVGAAF
jgi:hypothetical protein